MKMHADQLSVSAATVRQLLDQQFPEWRDRPVVAMASHGTVNALFRIGEELVARFPLQPKAVEAARRWLESEASAARELLGASCTPIHYRTCTKAGQHDPVAHCHHPSLITS